MSRASGSSGSAFKVYDWERPSAGRYSWERTSGGSDRIPGDENEEANFFDESSETEDEADYETSGAGTAGKGLLRFLLDEHLKGSMTAKQICIASWLAWKAGVEEVKKIALPPDTKGSGDFKRAVRSQFKIPLDSYTFDVPCFSRAEGDRAVYPLVTYPIHEVVEHELSTLEVESKAAAFEPPPNYTNNRLVKAFAAKGVTVAPLALFMDGVALGKRNSVLVISIQNLWTEKRWVVCGLRKRLLCKCGSLFSVFQYIAWSLQCMSHGRFPSQWGGGVGLETGGKASANHLTEVMSICKASTLALTLTTNQRLLSEACLRVPHSYMVDADIFFTINYDSMFHGYWSSTSRQRWRHRNALSKKVCYNVIRLRCAGNDRGNVRIC